MPESVNGVQYWSYFVYMKMTVAAGHNISFKKEK